MLTWFHDLFHISGFLCRGSRHSCLTSRAVNERVTHRYFCITISSNKQNSIAPFSPLSHTCEAGMLGVVLHSAKPRLCVPWLSRHRPLCFRRLYAASCSGILTNTSNTFRTDTQSPAVSGCPSESSARDSLEFRIHILKIPAERVTVQLPS